MKKAKITKEKIIYTSVISIISLILAGLIVVNFLHIYKEYDIPPTCEAEGGHFKECILCGEVYEMSQTSASGHKPATKITIESSAAKMGVMETRCTVCKRIIMLERTPAKFSPIPTLKLVGRGAGMTNVNSISASFKYAEGVEDDSVQAEEVNGDVRVRLMNGGERVDAKHSYVLNNFTVPEGTQLLFGDFGNCEQIDIYANNDDSTFSRRTVTYKQWKNLVSENYHNYNNYISVSDDVEYAGFNMLLYIKSTKPDYSFAGIYTLSVPYHIIAEKNSDANIKYVVRQKFSKKDKDSELFEYEFGDPSQETSAIEALKKTLALPADQLSLSDDVNYTNILIDYFTFTLITGNIDGFSDIYWVTSNGVTWYPVPANTEHSYGGKLNSIELSSPDEFTSGFGAFWDRLFDEYYDDIKARYVQLRDTRLSPSSISLEFERSVSKLDVDVYEADSHTYNSKFKDPYLALKELDAWYISRLEVLDELFNK